MRADEVSALAFPASFDEANAGHLRGSDRSPSWTATVMMHSAICTLDVYVGEAETALASARALSHPLRVALLGLLADGPRTSAQAARDLGTHTGATSFHLRQLARYGMIEPDPRGTGRERPWRLVPGGPLPPDGGGGSGMDAAEERRYRDWLARRDYYPTEWARRRWRAGRAPRRDGGRPGLRRARR